MRTTTRRMLKALSILIILLGGCTTYTEVQTYPTTGPLYAPTYNVEPLKQYLIHSQLETIKLEAFVKKMQSPNLINLERALHSYKYSAKNLYDCIVSSTNASVNYSPWQTQ